MGHFTARETFLLACKLMTACAFTEPEFAGNDRVQEERRTIALCTLTLVVVSDQEGVLNHRAHMFHGTVYS